MMETWHPLGVVGVISAFNFPVAVWAWNAALALVCGDPVVWKPSEKTPLTALAIQALFDRARPSASADAPDGAGASLIGGRAVGEALVDDRARSAWSRRPARPRMGRVVGASGGAPLRPRASSSSAATTRRSSRRRPTSTWRCAPSPSARWAPPASAAPRCAASSSTKASTTPWSPKLAKRLSRQSRVGDPREPPALVGPLIDGARVRGDAEGARRGQGGGRDRPRRRARRGQRRPTRSTPARRWSRCRRRSAR